MSRTDFKGVQAELFALHNIPLSDLSREETDQFLPSWMRRNGGRVVMSIGSGHAIREIAALQEFPDSKFTLVEPSLLQHAYVTNAALQAKLGCDRITIFRGSFENFLTAESFDIIYARHSWYYAHSKEDFGRAMGLLVEGGVFLIVMWCIEARVSRQCRDLGYAGKSRLGHLLSAEELLTDIKGSGYRVSVNFRSEQYWTSRRIGRARKILADLTNCGDQDDLTIANCLSKLNYVIGNDAGKRAAYWKSSLGVYQETWLAYITATEVKDLTDDMRTALLNWEAANTDACRLYAEICVFRD